MSEKFHVICVMHVAGNRHTSVVPPGAVHGKWRQHQRVQPTRNTARTRVQATSSLLAARRKEMIFSLPLAERRPKLVFPPQLTCDFCLEGTALPNRLAASRNYKNIPGTISHVTGGL